MSDNLKNIILRFGIVYLLIVVGFILIIYKIVVIQTVEGDNWLAIQEKSKKNDIIITPKRGNIYAYDGRLLASSIPTYKVYIDMRTPALHVKDGKLFKENIDSVALGLSQLFKDKPASEYKRVLTSAYNRKDSRLSLYPKRIPYYQLKEMRQLPLFRMSTYQSGLIIEESVDRVKPFGSLASRTIGEVYKDMSKGGINGLEEQFDHILTGQPGIAIRQKIANTWQETVELEPSDGMDIVTTIDIDLQDISEKALLDALNTYNAQSGYVILMETKTGEIKSMVNMQRNSNGTYSENWNGAISDLMEPGSTFKVASLMVALDDGKVKLTDSIETGKGIYYYGKRAMRDHNHHKGGYGKITVEEAIHASSNIGISRVIEQNYGQNRADFVEKLYKTNIVDSIQIGLAGTAAAKIYHPKERPSMSLAWTSIGYETQVPPIYTLRFYNAIANDGKMIRPILVKSVSKDGNIVETYKTETINRSICKSSTLDDLRQAMLGVVEGRLGTAKDVRSPHVRIAGKTGTAQISQGKSGYKAGGVAKYVVSFCGYFPADDPQYTGIVVIREPHYAYVSAGLMSGKTFKNIAERTIALKTDIKPGEIVLDSIALANIMPNYKTGNQEALKTVAKNVKLKLPVEENNNKRDINNLYVEEDIHALIPNVKGMGAKDAVYMLESYGLEVKLQGRGKVTAQSISPGTQAKKGNTITLNLN